MVKAENDKDDYGYDIFEYYANRNPYARELIISSNERYHNYTFKSIINITTLNYTIDSPKKGWYDSDDDKFNKLSYQLYVKGRYVKLLIYPSLFQLETFIFTIPHISDQVQYTEVDFYVTATDKEGASTSKYTSMNVSNTYMESTRMRDLASAYR